MKIEDFKVGQDYSRDDLRSAFGGSFMRGMNKCNKTNTLVLISKHTKNRVYGDQLCENNETIIYTGEGLQGDQTMTGANKTLNEADRVGIPVHLFIVEVAKRYKYYGLVTLSGEPYYEIENDISGSPRKVIRFPLMRKTWFRMLREEELSNLYVGGNVIPEKKPVLQVVGAAIVGKDGKVLCAQRGYGSLIGKWEFPGGKIEGNESDKEALIREIKEELDIDIEVSDLIEESYVEGAKQDINLRVYKCKHISGEVHDVEHQSLRWIDPNDLASLDWAEADKPVVDSYLESLPASIDEKVMFNYLEARGVEPTNKELKRAVQDYERSQRKKQQSGEACEIAVLHYERARLSNLGRPDLADLVKWAAKESSDYGYDVRSFDIKDNHEVVETHIEVKSVQKMRNYIEFFLTENELKKFSSDPNHKIYCLYKVGRNYKLHEVNKEAFRNEYLTPMAYRVRIRVAE